MYKRLNVTFGTVNVTFGTVKRDFWYGERDFWYGKRDFWYGEFGSLPGCRLFGTALRDIAIDSVNNLC